MDRADQIAILLGLSTIPCGAVAMSVPLIWNIPRKYLKILFGVSCFLTIATIVSAILIAFLGKHEADPASSFGAVQNWFPFWIAEALVLLITGPLLIYFVCVSPFLQTRPKWLRRGATASAVLLTVGAGGYLVNLQYATEHPQISAQGGACDITLKLTDEIKVRQRSFENAILAGAEKPLGSPHCWNLVQRASTSGFEKAVEIWIINPVKGFFLMQNFASKAGAWEFHAENMECDNWWCNAKTNVRALHFESLFGSIPTGKFPPFGATARFLSENQDRFKDIAWQEWDCEMTTPTFYQQFDHAKAFGVYPNSYHNNGGRITLLYDDNSYQILNPDGLSGTPCVNDGLKDPPAEPHPSLGRPK